MLGQLFPSQLMEKDSHYSHLGADCSFDLHELIQSTADCSITWKEHPLHLKSVRLLETSKVKSNLCCSSKKRRVSAWGPGCVQQGRALVAL